MEEPVINKEVQPEAKAKKTNKLLWPIVLVLVVLLGAGAYYWRDVKAKNQHDTDTALISKLQKDLDAAKKTESASSTSTTTTTTTTTTVPTVAAKENIIDSIKSGNTAALEGYMATSVHVVIAASEGVFDRTPAQALTDLNYISSATSPWDFALSSATLASYASGDYKDYFKSNSVVGVSADKKVVVFNFNDSGKINAIFMAASSDLL